MQKAEKEESFALPIIPFQPGQQRVLSWALISIAHNDKAGGTAQVWSKNSFLKLHWEQNVS